MRLLSSPKLVNWLAVVGLVLFVFGAVYPVSYVFLTAKARQLDGKGVLLGGGKCGDLQIDLHLDKRFIGLDESEKLTATLRNLEDEPCKARVRIRPVKVEVSPPIEQTIDFAPGQVVECFWILSPKESGTFQIAVEAEDSHAEVGITARNVFGLGSKVSQLFSVVALILGPIVTIPWWLEPIRRMWVRLFGSSQQVPPILDDRGVPLPPTKKWWQFWK